MLTFTEFILPFILVALIVAPLIRVFLGNTDKKVMKRGVIGHIVAFFSSIAIVLVFAFIFVPKFSGAEGDEEIVAGIAGTLAQGLGFLGAAIVTGASCLGAGLAVGNAAPAAIGSFSENPKNFSKAMIFVVLGEGVAIYGLLISILIINKL